MTSVLSYFRESIEELNQVRWPTRQQAIRLSIIVVLFTVANSIVFGLLDIGIAELIRLLLSTAA